MADSDSNSARKSYQTSIPSRKQWDSANNARDVSISRSSASGMAASRPAVSFVDGRSGQLISLSDSTEDEDDDDVALPPRKRTRPEKLQSFEETMWNLASPFSIKAHTFLSNTKKNDNFHNHGQYWKVGEYSAKMFQMQAEVKLHQRCQIECKKWRAVKWDATAMYNKAKEDWIVTTFSHTGEFSIDRQWRDFEETIKHMINSGKKNVSASLSLEYEIYDTETSRAMAAKAAEEDAANRPSKMGTVD